MIMGLRSPKICRVSWQAGDPEEFQSESEGLRTRRANEVSSSPKANRLKTQEELMC